MMKATYIYNQLFISELCGNKVSQFYCDWEYFRKLKSQTLKYYYEN